MTCRARQLDHCRARILNDLGLRGRMRTTPDSCYDERVSPDFTKATDGWFSRLFTDDQRLVVGASGH